jgi:hypothetical protein
VKTGVADTASLDVLIVTGTKYDHLVFNVGVGGQSLIYLYEAAVATAGTAMTVYNMDRNSATTALTTVTHTPTGITTRQRGAREWTPNRGGNIATNAGGRRHPARYGIHSEAEHEISAAHHQQQRQCDHHQCGNGVVRAYVAINRLRPAVEFYATTAEKSDSGGRDVRANLV